MAQDDLKTSKTSVVITRAEQGAFRGESKRGFSALDSGRFMIFRGTENGAASRTSGGQKKTASGRSAMPDLSLGDRDTLNQRIGERVGERIGTIIRQELGDEIRRTTHSIIRELIDEGTISVKSDKSS